MSAICAKLLVFQVGEQLCALSVEVVREIVPMAELARPPGQPSVLEGFLNLHGTAVPVLRIHRLFDLPAPEPGLYTPLIILRGGQYPTALLVDSVTEIVSPPADAFLPVEKDSCFNDCAQAQVAVGDRTAHLLSSERLLLEKERRCVAEFQVRAQQLLDELEVRPA
jgi:purine-binding chemotaxis protein CheW